MPKKGFTIWRGSLDRNVKLFDGTTVRITCDDEDRAEVINSVMIEPFIDDITEGWLATGERSMPAEIKVKAYLTYIGYLLIEKPDSHGVLSMKKIRAIRNNELTNRDMDNPSPASPIAVNNRRGKVKTRFEKYTDITSGNTKLSCAAVDTEGCFVYDDEIYKVVDSKYAGQKAAGWDCPYYQFDRIWIGDDGILSFYDQNLDPIPDEHIFMKTDAVNDAAEINELRRIG